MLLPPHSTHKFEKYFVTVQALLMLPCGTVRAILAGPALPLHLELQPAVAVLQGFQQVALFLPCVYTTAVFVACH